MLDLRNNVELWTTALRLESRVPPTATANFAIELYHVIAVPQTKLEGQRVALTCGIKALKNFLELKMR